MLLFLKQLLALFLLVSLLSGCAVVPTFKDERIPTSCHTITKSVDLEFVISKDGDLRELARTVCTGGNNSFCEIAGVTIFLSSLAISGSIYIIGNTAYYIEKSVRCDE